VAVEKPARENALTRNTAVQGIDKGEISSAEPLGTRLGSRGRVGAARRKDKRARSDR
jgi:hypothetical protein